MKFLGLLLVLIILIPTILTAQVKINEVLYSTSNDQIELKNFGTSAVDVSNMWACSRFSYAQISNLTVVSGNLNIQPGGILALSGFNLNDTSADLGLYNDVGGNTANFANASFMQDFVQWGDSGIGRESVAASKGIWTAGDFVPTAAAGHSIEYDGDGNSSSDWFEQANPTIGAENGVVTSVNDDVVSIPVEFSLAQNYPNPFNPSTIITYTIPQSVSLTTTRLEIFNMLGQKVRTLVNEQQPSGSYSVEWNGRDDSGELLASGVYMYRLSVGEFVDIKKMSLLK
ncbi:MAG: FlgD immunoglobulin-like domain containing protein [bacterium]